MEVVVRVSVAAICAALVVAGCTAEEPETPAEGEGEGEGEGEEGEGEGEGENPDGCAASGCPAGQQCGSIFGASATPACFATCAGGTAPCTTALGDTGECRSIQGFEEPVCRAQAADLEACGNAANAGCAGDDSVCVTFPVSGLFPDGQGICAAGCDVDADCGDAALGCTKDVTFRLNDVVLGMCVPKNDAADAACGRVAGSLALCTGELQCRLLDQNDTEGTCGPRE